MGPEIQYFQQLPGEGMLEAGELPFEPKGFKECFSCSSRIARNKVPFLLNNIKMNRRTIIAAIDDATIGTTNSFFFFLLHGTDIQRSGFSPTLT